MTTLLLRYFPSDMYALALTCTLMCVVLTTVLMRAGHLTLLLSSFDIVE